MNQTVKQIHTAFDAVLDILSLQEERAASLGLPPQDANNFKAFLERTAIDLMSLSALRLSLRAQIKHNWSPEPARLQSPTFPACAVAAGWPLQR